MLDNVSDEEITGFNIPTGIPLAYELDDDLKPVVADMPAEIVKAVERIGERSFEVLGDYVAGPSHTMPTGGTARFASPLNVLDFMKISSIVQLDAETSAKLSPIAARIALSEELTAHENAALIRLASAE